VRKSGLRRRDDQEDISLKRKVNIARRLCSLHSAMVRSLTCPFLGAYRGLRPALRYRKEEMPLNSASFLFLLGPRLWHTNQRLSSRSSPRGPSNCSTKRGGSFTNSQEKEPMTEILEKKTAIDYRLQKAVFSSFFHKQIKKCSMT